MDITEIRIREDFYDSVERNLSRDFENKFRIESKFYRSALNSANNLLKHLCGDSEKKINLSQAASLLNLLIDAVYVNAYNDAVATINESQK